MKEPTDEHILDCIRVKGDWEKGFRMLIEKYQERLYWQIRKIVGEHEDAHDVIQNTMIKVFHNIQRFEEKSRLYTWLYRIATNEAITYRKKGIRKNSKPLDGSSISQREELRADAHFDGVKAEEMLYKAIGKLPEKQRLVFTMRYFDELSYREMAELLHTSEGALKASFHHAVKKIEKYLSERAFPGA